MVSRGIPAVKICVADKMESIKVMQCLEHLGGCGALKHARRNPFRCKTHHHDHPVIR